MLSQKETEEAEKKTKLTPDKVSTPSVDEVRSSIVTRSAKKMPAARGNGTRTLRSASWHVESDTMHTTVPDPLIQKQEESAAGLTDHSDKKEETEMFTSEGQVSETKMTENLGKKNAEDSDQRNQDTLDGLKKGISTHSPEKKQVSTPRADYETCAPNLKADKITDCSVTETLSHSPRKGPQKAGDKNSEQKGICSHAFDDESIKFEREENEEERRRRIRLSHILESSGMMPEIQEKERGMTQTVDNSSPLKDTVTYVPSSDCAMIAGDGQVESTRTKSFLTQDTKNIDFKTEERQLSVTTDGNLEAGGDASALPGIQHFVNKTNMFRNTASQCMDKSLPFRELAQDSSAQPHQITKPSEKIPKRTSIQKGELVFQDPPVIPIRPTPAINEMGARENESAVDSLTTLPPYMNPDIGLLYQPEAGVMKSKPVPKPTRGRRSRRRSPTSLTRFPEYHPFVPHPDMHFPEQARFMPGHPYPRYMPPEFAHGLPADCCDVVPGHGGAFVTAYPAEAPRVVMEGDEEGMAPAYPANRWYCKEDIFKVPRPIYAPAPRARARGGSGGRGRPRGRRGSGGVRQYLQHRLLWARYTGRSQEALDRVLSIINSKCGLQEDAPKETPQTRLWGVGGGGSETPLDAAAAAAVAAAAAAAEETDEGLYGRLDNRDCAPELPTPPYPRAAADGSGRAEPEHYGSSPYYRGPVFSSNISNMMSGGNSSNASILSQSGIASNAVVDGNGYIVYLNQDDSADLQHQAPIPFVPSEASLSDRGDSDATILDRPPTRGSDVKGENDVRKTDEMTQPDPGCVGIETSSIVPNKMIVEGMPSESALAETGATGETTAVAAMPLESSVTSAVSESYPEKDNGKRQTARKRGTPKSSGVKTPVSPVKEPKTSKRHCQTSGGRQKKKVRRSLTFCSPIKQEETLRATENIANALTNTGSEDEASATCNASSTPDFQSSTTLPSISNLLHSSTNAGISINIHVTNDANKERAAPRPSSEDVGGGSRLLPAALDQSSNKAMVRTEVTSRPGEAAPLLHYPVPRYTVEWHGDYHQEPGEVPLDRPHRYKDHMMPVPVAPSTSAARFRYPYRDPNGSIGYYSQQRPFPAPSTPVDRYYTSEYAKEWAEAYAGYPPERFLTGYEMQPPSMSAPYPGVQWGPGWNRNPDMFMEPYQRHPGSRAALDVEMPDIPSMRDIPYHHFHRPGPTPYSRVQAEFPEEGYPQHCPPYSGYRNAGMVSHHHSKDRLVATVPEGVHDGKQEEDYESHRLQQTWAMTGGAAGSQVVPEGSAEQLAPETTSPAQVGCSILQPAQVDTGESSNQLPEEQTQM